VREKTIWVLRQRRVGGGLRCAGQARNTPGC
jgi:hypothetical protein